MNNMRLKNKNTKDTQSHNIEHELYKKTNDSLLLVLKEILEAV